MAFLNDLVNYINAMDSNTLRFFTKFIALVGFLIAFLVSALIFYFTLKKFSRDPEKKEWSFGLAFMNFALSNKSGG